MSGLFGRNFEWQRSFAGEEPPGAELEAAPLAFRALVQAITTHPRAYLADEGVRTLDLPPEQEGGRPGRVAAVEPGPYREEAINYMEFDAPPPSGVVTGLSGYKPRGGLICRTDIATDDRYWLEAVEPGATYNDVLRAAMYNRGIMIEGATTHDESLPMGLNDGAVTAAELQHLTERVRTLPG